MRKEFQRCERRRFAAIGVISVVAGGSAALTHPAMAQTTWPDASNTGVPAGTTLTPDSGTKALSAGQIYENRNLAGCINVNGANVIIRKSRITQPPGGCGIAVVYNNSTGLLLEDVEIICNGSNGTNGLVWGNYTARRVNIHNCENNMWAETNALVEDSYIHDTIPYNSGDPHTDSIQIGEGKTNITIRNNRIYGQYTSASNFGNSAITTGGRNSNVLITNNLFAGGGYTARCEGVGNNTNYRVINNRFSTVFTPKVGGWGPVNQCESYATTYSGNVYHETGVLLPNQTAQILPQPPANVRAQ